MNLLNTFSSDMYTGHRVLRVSSYEEFKSLHCPPDCELMAINKNPEINEVYMKRVDNLGNEVPARYSCKEIPDVPFEPENYVTIDQFNELREEIRHGFDSLKSATPTTSTGSGKSNASGK